MCLWRKLRRRRRPASSLPTTPTGSTFTPRSARLFTAFAPPPGPTVRLRCRRISTGASRDTREISPNTNSSATKSPSTVTVMRGNAATIFRGRSASLGARVIRKTIFSREIFSRRRPAFPNHAQNSIQSVSGVKEFHSSARDGDPIKRRKQRAEIDRVFFGGDETTGVVLLTQGSEIADIFLRVRVVVAVKLRGGWVNTSGLQLIDELLGASDATESDGSRRGFGDGDISPQVPEARTIDLQLRVG